MSRSKTTRTLPTSPNAISMSQVATELGLSQNGLSFNHGDVRRLAGVGANVSVSMSQLRGKSASASITFSCGQWNSQRGLMIGSESFGRLISRKACAVRYAVTHGTDAYRLHVVFTEFSLPMGLYYRAVIRNDHGGKITTDYNVRPSLHNTMVFTGGTGDIYNILVSDWINIEFQPRP